MLTKKNPSQTEKNLILEKKHFYDYVAVKKLFDKRSKVTASTKKEIRFIAETIKKTPHHYIGMHIPEILDLGCGNGRLSDKLAEMGWKVTGIDLSRHLIKEAEMRKKIRPSKKELRWKRFSIRLKEEGMARAKIEQMHKNLDEKENNLTYIHGNILNHPLPENHYYAIIMMWHVICEFKEYIPKLLKRAYMLLQNSGYLIFDIPDASIGDLNFPGHGKLYQNQVTPFMKYIGLIPELHTLFSDMRAMGFSIHEYKKVRWGINKIVVIATKK